MGILSSPTWALQPAAEKATLSTNYITTFNFLNQYLPDTYEKEFERYGNRSVASFLRMVGAELPSASDEIRWAEQGRLHLKYKNVTVNSTTNGAVSCTIVASGSDAGVASAPRVGATVVIQNPSTGTSNRGIVTVSSGLNFTMNLYDAAISVAAGTGHTVFIYGSEFKKGTNGMADSLESEDSFFSTKPIILKDTYAVNGSDMAQIGWVEVTSENGATGYLWYLKSQSDSRQRFDDYLETAMIESVPADSTLTNGAHANGYRGTDGVFYVVNSRGNVWGAGTPTSLTDWDNIVAQLDKQGAIEENVVFVNRGFGFDIDNMLATLNGYNGGSAAQGASYGLFDNDVQMALNLGFSGFRRGYDFYKSDWKYLNDPTMRGDLTTNANAKNIVGLLVPAGTTSVYDQVMGKNAKRPFLHVRYRASETEDRRYKTWITGGAGGAATSDLDAMQVNFLSERCVCVLGANNFMLFRYGA